MWKSFLDHFGGPHLLLCVVVVLIHHCMLVQTECNVLMLYQYDSEVIGNCWIAWADKELSIKLA